MAIPDFDKIASCDITRPVLQRILERNWTSSELIEDVGKQFKLTEQEFHKKTAIEKLKKNGRTIFAHKVHFANAWLTQFGLIDRPGGEKTDPYTITDRGRECMLDPPEIITYKYLIEKFGHLAKDSDRSSKSTSDGPASKQGNLAGSENAARHIGGDATKPTNLILYGPPGTGKTYRTRKEAVRLCGKTKKAEIDNLKSTYDALVAAGQITFVTFHQNYSYEDFVEGLRPKTRTGRGGQQYGFSLVPRPGIFRDISARAEAALAEHARKDAGAPGPDQFVLIIDEINRANISKVFGELITLLEPDKRIGAKNEMRVTLPYSGEKFGVPCNLHIVGTMNTADRSIALLDTALRRRFEFDEMTPKPEKLDEPVEGVNLQVVLRAMNERIEYLFDREHLIGHAYFMDCESKSDIDTVMRRKIIPLLAEYFYENWEKVAQVLYDPPGQKGFLHREPLTAPDGNPDDGRAGERYRWTVVKNFADNIYDQFRDQPNRP